MFDTSIYGLVDIGFERFETLIDTLVNLFPLFVLELPSLPAFIAGEIRIAEIGGYKNQLNDDAFVVHFKSSRLSISIRRKYNSSVVVHVSCSHTAPITPGNHLVSSQAPVMRAITLPES
jgi:hypothetical protein